MNKPKLLFVFDTKNEKYWMDGLWAALNLLEADLLFSDKRNLQEYKDLTQKPAETYDFVLGWGGFNSSVDRELQKPYWENVKKGLCIGGNAFPPTGADNYDVLFYETKWYRPQISFHKNIVHAFGVNTDIFCEINIPTPVVWDYIGVGAFADWKRWEKMLDKKGTRLVIGEFQEGNVGESAFIAGKLLQGGVMVSNMVNPYDLANYYHYSRTLYMPANELGGGERAILEARACGLQVKIEEDNQKLKEIVEGPIYDHHYYAKQLKKGILSCL